MPKRTANRSKYRGNDIWIEKDKPEELAKKIIVPPHIKVQRIPGISREEYFSGENYYYRKTQRAF